MIDTAPASARIERSDLDAQGRPCCEGYYAMDGTRLILMPPSAEFAPPGTPGKICGLRLATRAEVDRGGAAQASAEHIANCVANPSDAER